MLGDVTGEELVEEDETGTGMKRSRASGIGARKRKELGGGKIKEENDYQLLSDSFSQVPHPLFSLSLCFLFLFGSRENSESEEESLFLFFLCGWLWRKHGGEMRLSF